MSKAVKKTAERTVNRSAETGKMVTAKTAKENPATTVTEKVRGKITLEDVLKFELPKFSMPKTPGAVADLAYVLREQRYAVQHLAEALKERQTECEEYLINNLDASDQTGAAGKTALARIEKEEVPTAEDWEAIQKYIKKTGSFDLLQRRLNTKAVTERWENGKTVPGVGKIQKKKVSLTKVKGAK